MDQELQHFLISGTDGEALEVIRRSERDKGLEQWRRLAALYDPLAAGPRVTKIDDLSHALQAWRTRNKDAENT